MGKLLGRLFPPNNPLTLVVNLYGKSCTNVYQDNVQTVDGFSYNYEVVAQ